MRERELYCDARRYDLVMGEYAVGDMLEFYRRQIALYGQPVLELACGIGFFYDPAEARRRVFRGD